MTADQSSRVNHIELGLSNLSFSGGFWRRPRETFSLGQPGILHVGGISQNVDKENEIRLAESGGKFLDLKCLLFSGISLSGIGGYPPTVGQEAVELICQTEPKTHQNATISL